jgi:ABC-type branched-subunit amino acid transport system substrate-binding protein
MLAGGCIGLAACQLVGGITDRTLASLGGDDASTVDSSIDSPTESASMDSSPEASVTPVAADAAHSDGGDESGNDESGTDGSGGDGASAGCLTNTECTAMATADGPLDAGASDAAADAMPFSGTLDGGVVPAVCVRSVGRCARLLTQDCRAVLGDYLNDNSIVIGTLFNTTGSLAGANIPRQEAALLAATEINSNVSGGGVPGPDGGTVRPLVVVECDPTANALRAAGHLADDLHVPAVVGPNVAEDGINITQQVSAKAGMLLLTPTIPIDPLTNVADNGLTWRDVPADRQRAPLYGDQIGALVTQLQPSRGTNLKLGVVVRSDALGSSALNSISNVSFGGSTIGSSGPNVSIDEYALSDTAAQAAIATKYATTFVPDIIFVIAQEAVANIVIPLEQQLTTSGWKGNRPYYIATDTAKTTGWLSTPSNVPADLQTRVRGVGVTPDTASVTVFNSFNAAFKGYYGANPGTSGMGPSYDAMYSIAYAMAAVRNLPVSGTSVAQGLNQLMYGASFPVGVNSASGAFQALASAGHIALQGTFTLMHWDSNGDMLGGTLQVWCVATSSGTPAFAASGRTMDLTSMQIAGTYTQCN